MAEVGKSDVEEVTQKMDQVKVDDHPQEASNGIAEGRDSGNQSESEKRNPTPPLEQGGTSGDQASSRGGNQNTTVFVASIPFEANEAEVRQYFASCGRILVLRMLCNSAGRFKGSCFIKFDSVEASNKACSLNGSTFMTRTLYVSMSISRPQASKQPPPEGCRTVFVGNLDTSLPEEAVTKLLAPCGTIVNVKLIKEKFSGLSKGFCFVEFSEESGAHQAVKLNGTTLNGRQIKVDYQRPRPASHHNSKGMNSGGQSMPYMMGQVGMGQGQYMNYPGAHHYSSPYYPGSMPYYGPGPYGVSPQFNSSFPGGYAPASPTGAAPPMPFSTPPSMQYMGPQHVQYSPNPYAIHQTPSSGSEPESPALATPPYGQIPYGGMGLHGGHGGYPAMPPFSPSHGPINPNAIPAYMLSPETSSHGAPEVYYPMHNMPSHDFVLMPGGPQQQHVVRTPSGGFQQINQQQQGQQNQQSQQNQQNQQQQQRNKAGEGNKGE